MNARARPRKICPFSFFLGWRRFRVLIYSVCLVGRHHRIQLVSGHSNWASYSVIPVATHVAKLCHAQGLQATKTSRTWRN